MTFKISWKRILIFLAVIGPGIITANVDNDAGGITTYSVAGAQFGYSMLWSLIPITVALIIIQEMAARMGVVTGKGLAELIRENFGLKITFFIMIGLLIANVATTISEFAGIASAGAVFGISKFIIVPICAVIVWFLILKFSYKRLEKVFLFMILFYVAYVVSGLMSGADWGEVAKATAVPQISLNPLYLIVLVGVIGTTITPWMQFYLQSSIAEKGVKLENYKYSRIEVIIGSFMTDIVSFFIIVACGATLFANNIAVENAADAAIALEPLLGNLARSIFALGFFGAALFGAFILPLATAYYICEAFGWESGINREYKDAKVFYNFIAVILIIAAIVVLIPNIPLINVMLTSQIINGVILPFTLIPMILLINKKKIMGRYTNNWFYNLITWATVAVMIMLSLGAGIGSFFAA